MGSVLPKQTLQDNADMFAEAEDRYKAEREKRLRKEGMSQFVELYSVEKFRKFIADPWIKESTATESKPLLEDGSRCKILIIGTGYSGLLFAVRLIQAGFKASDIHMVDNAGGFGGTWYWNRYPGLMCDIESYIYMPLLEETGYMPSQKYVSGTELREYAERIAAKWNLTDRATFSTKVTQLRWDDAERDWKVILRPQKDGQDLAPIDIRSHFTVLTTGFTVIPHVPRIDGLEGFKGDIFHTARWDYESTGGSSTDSSMIKLKDKRVGIIGTGATAIQVVPALADWAKKLYVFQRTPSAVDRRDNTYTDAEWWNCEVTSKQGWQEARRNNFNAFVSNLTVKPPQDMVSDGWTRMLSYSALVGCGKLVGPDAVEKYTQLLHALDYPRQESIRQRAEEIVKDKDTAEKLKAWYPGWCKRPCFHDEYLQAFNRDNVMLVDTDGRGVEKIDNSSIVAAGNEFPIDVLILSTGYRSPFLYSPGQRVGIDIYGRNNCDLDKKWTSGVTTLHGMMSHDFPNLFWPGFSQAGGSPNFVNCLDKSAVHIANILAHGKAKVATGKNGFGFTVEATAEAEEEWSHQVAQQAGAFAATAGCTPSYINAEGELDRTVPVEVLQKRARGALWGKGFQDFQAILEDWRARGDYKGIEFI